ncbi:MAG: retroviral-like aspartic protease [Acaryochloridaceae cyanobacterium RU_4_10]|nr:retroviral-like aspartic protease [Acaryochloridaceae cyanobacterium RU_4_10]
MHDSQRFSFTERIDSFGRSVIMPYLPLTLSINSNSVEVVALLDTGASVNVLPYELGLQLGAIWEEQTVQVQLSGNLGRSEARGLALTATVAQFSPILLVFAWTQARDAPIILGHMNFFAEFNVCFYRHEMAFEIQPRVR